MPERDTTELFVAGRREDFAELPAVINGLQEQTLEALEFAEIEDFRPYAAPDRIKAASNYTGTFFEVGLHLLPEEPIEIVRDPFVKFATQLGFSVYTEFEFTAGRLLFYPLKGGRRSLEDLARFTLLRVVRPMPRLRGFRPVSRSSGVALDFKPPAEGPLSDVPRVAILDGGLPKTHAALPWIRRTFKADGTARDNDDCVAHGLGVTSAFLFGPISPKSSADRPYSYVDHHRVLDAKSFTEPPLELYRTLGHVEEILLSRQYEFINLSLGPDLPIEDTDVHSWTSVIDELLSDGATLMAIAAGNNGELDRPSGNARIQVPADCVNAICVGAADSQTKPWRRASYSALGPGRSPGRRKPDIVAFGGSPSAYFHVVSGVGTSVSPQLGTSFAAPYLLRAAVGIRAIMGSEIHPLTIKALLIHTAQTDDAHSPEEVGWGRHVGDLDKILTCPAGVARIIYQGELKPGKFLRAPVPLPATPLKGNVTLAATFCYASPVDPQDASAYTKAGLTATFRPDASKIVAGAKHAKARSFFPKTDFRTEEDLRDDLGKWETALHAAQTIRGSGLNNAAFDIHYNARDAGMPSPAAPLIRYSLVITVEAHHHPEIYEEILTANKVLVALQPQIPVPIRV